jgi:hypothetical protein
MGRVKHKYLILKYIISQKFFGQTNLFHHAPALLAPTTYSAMPSLHTGSNSEATRWTSCMTSTRWPSCMTSGAVSLPSVRCTCCLRNGRANPPSAAACTIGTWPLASQPGAGGRGGAVFRASRGVTVAACGPSRVTSTRTSFACSLGGSTLTRSPEDCASSRR